MILCILLGRKKWKMQIHLDSLVSFATAQEGYLLFLYRLPWKVERPPDWKYSALFCNRNLLNVFFTSYNCFLLLFRLSFTFFIRNATHRQTLFSFLSFSFDFLFFFNYTAYKDNSHFFIAFQCIDFVQIKFSWKNLYFSMHFTQFTEFIRTFVGCSIV